MASFRQGFVMTLCPLAALVGCQKCPVFKLCLVKKWVGDMPETPSPEVSDVGTAAPAKPAARSAPRKSRTGVAAKPPVKAAPRPRKVAAKGASKPAG
jgi:hypothetical protein